jgi:hypothetical protein
VERASQNGLVAVWELGWLTSTCAAETATEKVRSSPLRTHAHTPEAALTPTLKKLLVAVWSCGVAHLHMRRRDGHRESALPSPPHPRLHSRSCSHPTLNAEVAAERGVATS